MGGEQHADTGLFALKWEDHHLIYMTKGTLNQGTDIVPVSIYYEDVTNNIHTQFTHTGRTQNQKSAINGNITGTDQ